MAKILVRRGTKAQLDTVTLLDGEICWTTDTNELWIGNGTATEDLATGCIVGTLAARPSAGVIGRIYFDSTNNEYHIDDGSTWNTLSAGSHNHDLRYYTETEIGGIVNGSSGADLVGATDNFDNSNATTVQGALEDLDSEITILKSSTPDETIALIVALG